MPKPIKPEVVLQPVNSSMFTHAAYDEIEKRGLVRFTNGELRSYAMPQSVFEALLASESLGKHYVEHIRGKYPSVKL